LFGSELCGALSYRLDGSSDRPAGSCRRKLTPYSYIVRVMLATES
jgi:hypothetical protein